VKGPVRAALGLASLSALCSFLIAVFALVAYQLGLVDIIQPLTDGPALHPVTALSVILLATCVVLTTPRARPFIDGVCAVVLLGALARLAFPDEASLWLQQHNTYPAKPEAVVSTGTALCLLLLAASLATLKWTCRSFACRSGNCKQSFMNRMQCGNLRPVGTFDQNA